MYTNIQMNGILYICYAITCMNVCHWEFIFVLLKNIKGCIIKLLLSFIWDPDFCLQSRIYHFRVCPLYVFMCVCMYICGYNLYTVCTSILTGFCPTAWARYKRFWKTCDWRICCCIQWQIRWVTIAGEDHSCRSWQYHYGLDGRKVQWYMEGIEGEA